MKNNRKTNSRKHLGLRLLGGAICCVMVLEGNMTAVAAKDIFNRETAGTVVNGVTEDSVRREIGSGQIESQQTQIPEYKTNIYEQKFISLDLDAKWNDVIGMQKKDGRVYFVVETREWDDKKVNDSDASDQTTDSKEKPKVTAKYYLFSMNEDGEDLKKVELDLVSTNTETWRKVEGKSWFCFVQDWVCIFDEVSGQICRFKMDGTLLQTIEMEQGVFIRNLYEVNNELYIFMGKPELGILHVNSDGKMDGWNPIQNNGNKIRYYKVSNFVDGKLYISCEMENEQGYTFGEFDPISGNLIKNYELDKNYLNHSYVAEDGRVYRSQYDIFAYDLNKRMEEKVINAIPSGINFFYGNVDCNHFMMLGEKNYLYVEDRENESVISLLKYIPSEKVKDKKMITVFQATRVTEHWDEDYYKELIDFNKTNDDYVAVLYNGQHDWEDALRNGEIDVLEYSRSWDEEYNIERKLNQLGRDGALANVDLLIAKDPELSKQEYMENLWDVFRVDGNLYQVISGFDVESYVVKKALVDPNSNMTLPDLYDLAKQKGMVLNDILINPPNLLRDEIMYHREDYIDDKNGSCNFMTKEFLDLLEYAEVFYMGKMRQEAQENFREKEENKEVQSEEIHINGTKDKETLLVCFPGLGGYADDRKKFEEKLGKEDVLFIGHPGMKETTFAFNEYGTKYAISSNSHDLEAAWNYTRRFLTPEYAPTERFSVIKEIAEKQAEIGMPEQNKALFDYLCCVNKRGINDSVFQEFNQGKLDFKDKRTAMEKAEAIQEEVTKLLQRKGKKLR